jgi:hypothetical protein
MVILAWLLAADTFQIIAGKRPGAMWHEMATRYDIEHPNAFRQNVSHKS